MLVELQSRAPAHGPTRTAAGLGASETSGAGRSQPYFVYHTSFQMPGATREYGVATTPPDDSSFLQGYMPDEVTRDLARRMHYAAFRWQQAGTPERAGRWRCRYYGLRNRIILGNRKLVFRAASWRGQDHRHIDDLVGECDLVLIRAVRAYNPWLGIRFSTYALTCLLRAVARLRGRLAKRWVEVSCFPDGEAEFAIADPSPAAPDPWLPWQRYLRQHDPLLTPREKTVLERRYQLDGQAEMPTLERLGQELGLSKERVRQLQRSAVAKLRRALSRAAELA
jgi:RNA polymerase sigma factor (sigma-70 family)